MDSITEFTHDEEGYCGVTYDEFVERCPNLDGNDLDLSSDCLHPFGYADPPEASTFLKNIARTATRILVSSKFLNKTRRMFWGYFLGAYTQDSLCELASEVKRSRAQYWKKVDHYNRKNSIEQIHSLDPQIFHPLAPAETNPWAMSQMTKELMDEIWQDVERTYQERTLFQSEQVRKTLQRILFVWSMEHDYISYKQGMNELLAIIYIVCYRDQDRSTVEHNDEGFKHFKTIFSCSPKDMEADSYTLFNALMTLELQVMYDVSALKHSDKGKSNASVPANPIIARCNHIYNDLLKECDFNLYGHLKSIELEPHLFLIRWIRLMFSREFNVNETLNLWDFLLSDYYFDPKAPEDSTQLTHKSIDFFSVAMIIFVKQNLMENDINYCLQRLFKYPPIEDISLLTKKALDIKKKFLKLDTPEETASHGSEKFHDALEYDQERGPEAKYLHSEGFGARENLSPSTDNTPKSVVIKMLDDSTIIDTSSANSNESSDHESEAGHALTGVTNLREELLNLACEIYGIYEYALKNNKEDILPGLKNVHFHVSKIISNLDSLTHK